MEDLVSKISSYNILNYLLPGCVFAFATSYLGILDIMSASLLINLFLYYFIGMTISRIGSMIIEPAYKRLGLVEHNNYNDYLTATERDKHIAQLLEQCNVYRTSVALIASIAIVAAIKTVAFELAMPDYVLVLILGIVLFSIYTAAYWKQNEFIRKRVAQASKLTAK
jgi:hypothetical protein